MNEEKQWYESKTVWSGVVTLLAVALGAVGYTVTPEDQISLVAAVTAAAASIGSIVSIYGRVSASKKIARKGRE